MNNSPDKTRKEVDSEMRGMTQDDYKIHQEARNRFSEIMGLTREERELCRDDRRFYSVTGAQWEGDWGDQYENKARLEINKTHLAIIKIFSAFRNNPITCKFISRDGTDSDKLADVCNGLYRSDEQDSVAQEAYDNGFEEAVSGGFGAYRLTTVYEDEDDEDDDRQRIIFEPIFDADQSVFFDPNAKRQDKSDAMYAYVLTPYTPNAYKSEWGDDISSWPIETLQTENFDWVQDNAVYVAEYYRVEEEKRKFVWFQPLDPEADEIKVLEADLDEERLIEFEAIGHVEVRSKSVVKRCVKKYIMSGAKILEPGRRIAGPNIPIVPCYGKRLIVDNIERLIGHVRLAKDAQRLKNMQVSRLAEISAKSTIEKPIFYPEQVAGLEQEWADDVVEDFPYLRINMIYDTAGQPITAGAIGSTKPPMIPPALAALYQMTEEDLKDILGNQEGGEEIRSNINKDVVEQIHARLDMQTFIYMSNMAKSVQRGGQIWLGMAKEVYVEDGRLMKSVTGDGDASTIEIGAKELDGEGRVTSHTDLTMAKFNVYTNVAPASASRKAATVRNLTNMMGVTKDEQSSIVMSLFAGMNAEGEGMDDYRKYCRMRLVRMDVIAPSDAEKKKLEEEAKAKEGQNPDANEMFIKAEADKANAQAEEARARTETAKANSAKAIADKEKVEAETIAKLAEMHPVDRQAALEAYAAMKDIGAQTTPPPPPAPMPAEQPQPELTQPPPIG